METPAGSKFFIAGSPFKSPDFDTLTLTECEFRLFISPYQLICSILNDNHQVAFLQPFEPSSLSVHFIDFVNAALKSNFLFKGDYKKKVIIQLNQNFVLVPSEFSGNEFADKWSQGFVTAGKFLMCHDVLKALNAEVIYPFDADIKEQLDAHVSNYSIQNVVSNELDLLIPNNVGKTIYCIVHSCFLQILFLEENELRFVNIFHYQSPEDFIYYVLAVYKMNGLDPEQDKIILLGEIVKDSATYKLVYKYVRNIEFGNVVDKKVFPENYPFPLHFYFSLLT